MNQRASERALELNLRSLCLSQSAQICMRACVRACAARARIVFAARARWPTGKHVYRQFLHYVSVDARAYSQSKECESISNRSARSLCVTSAQRAG